MAVYLRIDGLDVTDVVEADTPNPESAAHELANLVSNRVSSAYPDLADDLKGVVPILNPDADPRLSPAVEEHYGPGEPTPADTVLTTDEGLIIEHGAGEESRITPDPEVPPDQHPQNPRVALAVASATIGFSFDLVDPESDHELAALEILGSEIGGSYVDVFDVEDLALFGVENAEESIELTAAEALTALVERTAATDTNDT